MKRLTFLIRNARFALAKWLISEAAFEIAATEAYEAAQLRYEDEHGAPPSDETKAAMIMALEEFTPLHNFSTRI